MKISALIKKYVLLILKLLIVSCAMWYLISSGKLDVARINELTNSRTTIICLLLILSAQFICALRLCLYMNIFSCRYSVYKVFMIILKAMFFGTFMLGIIGSELLKFHDIKEFLPSRSARLTSILIDRLSGLLGMLLFAAIALSFSITQRAGKVLSDYSWIVVVVLVMMILVFPLIVCGRRLIIRHKESLPMGDKLLNIIHCFDLLKDNKRILFAGLFLSLSAHLISTLALYLIIQTSTDVGFWENASAASMGFLTAIIPLPLGGIGIGENAYDIAIREFSGMEITWSANVYLTYRFLTMLALLPGGVYYIFSRFNQQGDLCKYSVQGNIESKAFDNDENLG